MGESLDAERRAELSALRRRAYGPEPDIAGDEAALRRLSALERAAARTDGPVLPTRAQAHEIPGADSSAPDTADVAVVDDDAPPAEDVRPNRFPARPLTRWGIGALAVLVIMVALLAAFAPRPDAVLHPVTTPNPLPVWASDGWFDDYIDRDPASPYRVFESFAGVEPWTAMTRTGARCLILTFGTQIGSTEPSCGRNGIDPSFTLHITDWMPDGLRELGPTGTIVRFVLRDATVDVSVALPPAETPRA